MVSATSSITSPRRLGTPGDVVPAVLLVASDRASYITGQTLSVSGGYTMM